MIGARTAKLEIQVHSTSIEDFLFIIDSETGWASWSVSKRHADECRTQN